jgi:predicted RecB family nuclease
MSGRRCLVNPSPSLTDDIFAAYLKCRYKAYLKLRGATGERSEYEALQRRLVDEYRVATRGHLTRMRGNSAFIQDPPSVPEVLQSGVSLILNATVEDSDESCHLDGLERVGADRAAAGGAYIPALFIPHERITTDDKLRLAFGASILARVQGVQADSGRIVHGEQFKTSKVSLATLVGTVRDAVGQIRAIQESAIPPPLLLNRHCAECEFRRSCLATALEKDDLSLLSGLSPKEIAGLNRKGIFTVTQYSHTVRPRKARKTQTAGARKHHHSLQALAIRDRTIYVAEKPVLPSTAVRMYLDVEGLPDADFYYLIGLVIADSESKRAFSFWADGRQDEGRIWEEFLRTIAPFGEFAIFQYGSYESIFLRRMAQRYGGDPLLLKKIEANSVNVLSLIYSRVYFPVYANGLKSVATFLGFQWTVDGASGLQAVVWRKEWEANKNERAKTALITYNQEDCHALERVAASLLAVACDTWDGGTAHRVAAADDIRQGPCRNFGKGKYYFPELARITKCSYFDYQRKRILFRTSPLLKKCIRSKVAKRRKAQRVNTIISCRVPERCPKCSNADDLKVARQHSKIVLDLKLFRGGVKRWVTNYTTRGYTCKKCKLSFLPEDYLAASATKYGSNLCTWAVYTTVALRQTNENVVESLADLFNYEISPGTVSIFRRRAAEYYGSTYEALLQVLKVSPVVHADETKVSVRGRSTNGYVWAFANPETVYYVYAASREGKTVTKTLDGFSGVLVSDFYAAYDSLPCPQQKCLIHLARDFNDDLFKNPFNQELQQLGRDFTQLLQTVVETVDKFGLKRLHLSKHRKDVDRFYTRILQAEYQSEVAEYYRKRLIKNKDKLFTFLDHDGVPWNNNNGENAIKRFVALRKVLGTAFSEDGIKDYLVLLSISQTLRYRNCSFWKFLLSGETDIAAFTSSRR